MTQDISHWPLRKGLTEYKDYNIHKHKLVKFHCTVSSLICVLVWSYFSFFSIIKRLDQYDEFFPAFQSLVSELKRLLSECLCIHSYCVLYWDIAIAVIKCGSCVRSLMISKIPYYMKFLQHINNLAILRNPYLAALF